MSKFTTTIPVDVNAVIRALPEGSFVHKMNLKMESSLTGNLPVPIGIEIIWDSDKHKTPYTFPVDFPVNKLLKKSAETQRRKG